MKIKSLLLVFMVIVLGMTLGGCGCFMQQMRGETPPPPEGKVVAPEGSKEISVAAAQAQAASVVGLNDINFDFDKYNIRPADANILKSNAEWFKANSGKKMRIEGNCDERGTVEYNLALGQKRADAAKTYIVNLGVNRKLIETVSYGKERPVDTGHDEAAWAKNRRAHFLALP